MGENGGPIGHWDPKKMNPQPRKSLSGWMTDQGVSLPQLVESSGLERRVVQAIVEGKYTTSPQQRQRLAKVLGVAVDEVAWGQAVQVEHMYGHGPQFGRSP